ncbi:hypothetical protein GCM10009735_84720 [Actinomadura chokoriensis]
MITSFSEATSAKLVPASATPGTSNALTPHPAVHNSDAATNRRCEGRGWNCTRSLAEGSDEVVSGRPMGWLLLPRIGSVHLGMSRWMVRWEYLRVRMAASPER